MPDFNPAPPPTQDPNFAFWARPINEPRPNISGETLFKGVGNAIGEFADVADNTVKKGIIAPQVEEQAGAVRDQFVSALNTAKTALTNPPSSVDQPSLVGPTGDQTSQPPAVSRVGATATSLHDALVAGKISPSYYDGQLNSLAKSLRAQYPGYRDYVDQEISRVTGVHPANQYVRSLISDVNRLEAQSGEGKDKTQTLLMDGIKEGIPHMADMADGYKAGKVTASQVEHYYNDSMAFKYQHQADQAAWDSQEHSLKNDSLHAQQIFKQVATRVTGTYSGMQFTLAGHDPGSIQDLLERHANGEQFKDTDWITLGQNARVAYTSGYNQLKQYLNTADANGKSLSDRLGVKPNEEDEFIKSQLSGIEQQIKNIDDKDLGMMFSHAKMNEAVMEDNKNKLMSQPDVAKTAAALDLVKQVGGSQFLPAWSQEFVGQGGVQDQIQGWFKEKKLNAIAQPDAQPGGGGWWHTLFGDVKDGNARKIDDPNAYKGLLNQVHWLTDKTTPVKDKENLAQYFFSGQNDKIMTQFKEDWTDSQGVKHDGQYKVYSGLFSSQMAKSVKKLGDDYFNMYEHSATENANLLFRNQVATLQDLQNDPLVPKHFQYNSDGTLSMLDENGKPMSSNAAQSMHVHGITAAQTALDKVNTMLKSLKSVEDVGGGDTDAFLLKSLAGMGFDPGKNVEGIPSRIMQAIAASRGSSPKDMGEALGKD